MEGHLVHDVPSTQYPLLQIAQALVFDFLHCLQLGITEQALH